MGKRHTSYILYFFCSCNYSRVSHWFPCILWFGNLNHSRSCLYMFLKSLDIEKDFPRFSDSERRCLYWSVPSADHLSALAMYTDCLLPPCCEFWPIWLCFISSHCKEAMFLGPSYSWESALPGVWLVRICYRVFALCLQGVSWAGTHETRVLCFLQTCYNVQRICSNSNGRSRTICWKTIFDILRKSVRQSLRVRKGFSIGSIPHDPHIYQFPLRLVFVWTYTTYCTS